MPYYGYNGSGDRNPYRSFFRSLPGATKNIIVINIIIFVATLLNRQFICGTFGLFYPASPWFRPWQAVTHMFVHGGFWHLFFNMYSLLIFGTVLERALGTRKFLIFYLVTGLGAALCHTGVEHIEAQRYVSAIAEGSLAARAAHSQLLGTPTIGASGAVYGVLIGYAMLYPDSVLTLVFPPVSLKARWIVLIFAGVELLTGVTGTMDGVAHFAHLGGMLFGFLLMLYWKKTLQLHGNY